MDSTVPVSMNLFEKQNRLMDHRQWASWSLVSSCMQQIRIQAEGVSYLSMGQKENGS